MNVTLPRKIDRIGEGMFQNCHMLAGVEIPQGAQSIGARAFASCSGLTTVIIPNSVTTIGTAAFSACPLTDIYFTGTETQWKGISKTSDIAQAVASATIHYNYVPGTSPGPGPGYDDNDNNNNNGNNNNNSNNNNNGNNNNNSNSNNNGNNNNDSNNNNNNSNNINNSNGNNPGNGISGDELGNAFGTIVGESSPAGSLNDNVSSNTGSGSNTTGNSQIVSSAINSGIKAVLETWEPATPDERKRYACLGKEAVHYTQSKENAYQIDIENAMQGPMCFKSFEAVLGDYTIGRTYNIYALSKTTYSTDKKIQVTISIPSAIYKAGREYKMICVTKDGQPILYNDLDNNPQTITIKTNKFHAYALIYK